MTGNDEWAKLEEAEQAAPRTKKMSRMMFGRVKISNIDESLDEVLKAYETETYDEYLSL